MQDEAFESPLHGPQISGDSYQISAVGSKDLQKKSMLPYLQGQGDHFLMDIAMRENLLISDELQINQCRIHIQVLTVAEISMADENGHMTGVSDGSICKGQGSQAWVLAGCYNDMLFITRTGPIDGDAYIMSSYRPEMQG